MLKPIKARAQETIDISLRLNRSRWRHLYCLRYQVWLLPKSEGNQGVSMIFSYQFVFQIKWSFIHGKLNQGSTSALYSKGRSSDLISLRMGKIYYSLFAHHKFSQILKSTNYSKSILLFSFSQNNFSHSENSEFEIW